MMPVLQEVLGRSEPTMSDVADGRVLLVDATFVPTGHRPGQGRDVEQANYSGTHPVQCVTIQVACLTDGTLATVSEPVAGSRHDAAALRLCGWDDHLKDTAWIADTGYVGTNAITPRKKPRGVKRSEADKIFNTSVSSIRAAVENAGPTSRNGQSSPPATGADSESSPPSSAPSHDSNSSASDGRRRE